MTPIHYNTFFYFSLRVYEKNGLYIPKHEEKEQEPHFPLYFHYTVALVGMPKLEHFGNSEFKKFERTYPLYVCKNIAF